MIERDARLAASLRLTSQRLHADQVSVETVDALQWLAAHPSQAFDVVFVDPPFAAGLLDACLAALAPHLASEAWIYVECTLEQTPTVAADWRLHREGTTRDVRYALYARSAAGVAVGPATLAAASEAACEPPTR